MPVALAPHQRAWKVLIVDDVATNRELVDELLSRLGFVTRSAPAAEDAIALHDDWRPDLVLMDLRMPGMSGLEAIRLLRQRGSNAAIIAVTASGLADREHEARDAGADAYVRKPYREAELLATIGEKLGVRYTYGSAPARQDDARPGSAGRLPLAHLLSRLPGPLVQQLRDAAIEGRARRLESLADQARPHSEQVSAEIRALARDFQYDVLVSALGSKEPDDA
jgi:CheY-like chemotaxis protein